MDKYISASGGNIGKVSQVIGPVVDVHFADRVPGIYGALEVTMDKNQKLVL